MAKRIFAVTTLTPTATADTTNLGSGTYLGFIQGGAAGVLVTIKEVFLGGQATASAPAIILLSRDSTVAAGQANGTGATDAGMAGGISALSSPAIVGNIGSTAPQRSSTLHLTNHSFNAFGGTVRSLFPEEELPSIIGNTQPQGEVSLSAFTGSSASALMGSHIVYEPF
jgi:hypothetical protein